MKGGIDIWGRIDLKERRLEVKGFGEERKERGRAEEWWEELYLDRAIGL